MKKLLSFVVAFAFAASPLVAQAHPDFSGTWLLDSKSLQMGLTSLTLTVKQDAKTITVDQAAQTSMGDQKQTLVFNLDGTESKNTVTGPMGSIDMLATTTWAGDTLAVTVKADVQGQSLVQTDKWTLGADKKTLTVDRTVAAGGQNMALKLAFNKQ